MIRRESAKPASTISDWSGWPDDVREVLRHWNRYTVGYLSFRRSYEFPGRLRTFRCGDCHELAYHHANGTAVIGGQALCDDCLIVRARVALKKRNQA